MEAPPLTPLIFLGVLLGVFGLLITTLPSGFLAGSQEFRESNIPQVFESIDTLQYANTYNISFGDLTDDWGGDDFGHDMRFMAITYPSHRITNTHFYGFFASHLMHWINTEGVDREQYLYLSEILLDWNSQTNVAEYTVSCSHFNMKAWISYNTTEYTSLEDAWDNDNAKILFAIDFDQVGSTWNAWSLITQILFFQMPNVHWTLNLIIALPLWIGIAGLTFAFVIAMIKALPTT